MKEPLPVGNYSSEYAISQGFEKMVYSVIDRESGQTVYPAWQFVNPASKLLPLILAEFLKASEQIRTQFHAFLVTQRDELNELSPAEILVGIPFPRNELATCQIYLLTLDDNMRTKLVIDEARMYIQDSFTINIQL